MTEKERRDWRKAIKASIPEEAVQRDICAYLRARQIPHTVTDAALAYNAKGRRVVRVSGGWPDVTAVLPEDGRLLAIECKKPVDGRLRYDQAVTLTALIRARAIVVIARDLAEVETAIRLRVTPAATLDEIAKTLARGPEKKRATRAPKRIATK